MDVTASMLRSFKSCPKKYYFEYVEQLKPVQTPEALEIGSNYHDYLEMLLTGQSFEVDRKSTRLNSSHSAKSRMPSSA